MRGKLRLSVVPIQNRYPTDTSYIPGGMWGRSWMRRYATGTTSDFTFAAERTEPNIKLKRSLFPLHPFGSYGDAPNI